MHLSAGRSGSDRAAGRNTFLCGASTVAWDHGMAPRLRRFSISRTIPLTVALTSAILPCCIHANIIMLTAIPHFDEAALKATTASRRRYQLKERRHRADAGGASESLRPLVIRSVQAGATVVPRRAPIDSCQPLWQSSGRVCVPGSSRLKRNLASQGGLCDGVTATRHRAKPSGTSAPACADTVVTAVPTGSR